MRYRFRGAQCGDRQQATADSTAVRTTFFEMTVFKQQLRLVPD
jgi:hypothetical protein